MFFFLSLGSNIQPELSAVQMLMHLCEYFGAVGAYPYRYTKPEGIESHTRFLNSLVVLRSGLNPAEVKLQLNRIEEKMGRDRSDPKRSIKSRCADIDILGYSESLDNDIFASATESYVQACYCMRGPSPDLSEYGLTSYQRPSTIYFDALSRDIRVIEDEFECFKYGLEATLERK